MKKNIFVAGLVVIFLVLGFTELKAQSSKQNIEIFSILLAREGAEIKLEVPLERGNLAQNIEILKHCWYLYYGFVSEGWQSGVGRDYLGTVTFEYEERSKGFVIYAVVSIGKKDCPGELFNRFKCRKNKVYVETVPRAVKKCIDQVYRAR